ncbi:MAG: GNAT family N-acetyltransferase [Christensenellaceae bacterium]
MEKKFKLYILSDDMLDICVDLFIDTFSKEPWNDVYDSKKQVVDFFENHIKNNYFVGYVLKDDDDVVALSIGSKKPWIKGMEYYIDQLCVKADMQGLGIGSQFLRLICEDIKLQGMNAIILNTEKGFPSEKFYLKNGFTALDELVVLAL